MIKRNLNTDSCIGAARNFEHLLNERADLRYARGFNGRAHVDCFVARINLGNRCFRRLQQPRDLGEQSCQLLTRPRVGYV